MSETAVAVLDERVGRNESDIRESLELSRQSLELSRRAVSRLDGHEKQCGERYAEITTGLAESNNGLVRIHERIDTFAGYGWKSMVSAIVFLLSAIGYLLVSGTPWQ